MTTRRNAKDDKPRRTPVSGQRDILTVDGKEKGYSYRWVNDKDGRIEKFKDAGYEVVSHDVEVGQGAANKASTVGSVKSKGVGQGTTAILMRIKDEWYEEDQQSKQRDINEREASMMSPSRREGQYGNISIERK